MGYRNQRGEPRRPSAVPLRSRPNSATNSSTTATTIPSPTSANAAPPCSRSLRVLPPTPSPALACSAAATPTPFTLGWTTTKPRGCPASSPTRTGATVGGALDRQQRRGELQERLRQGPAPQDH